MELSGIAPGRRSTTRLAARLRVAEDSALIYDHVGSTLRSGTVPGVPDHVTEREVGGELGAAAAALRAWAAHAGIGARIHPQDAPLAEGTVLLVVAPFGPVEMLAPCRIVAVVDEADRFGFAYGTLAGHPEAGEERFLAEVVGPGRLRLSVRVQAVPATRLARLVRPVVHGFQRAATRRYLDGWAAAIS